MPHTKGPWTTDAMAQTVRAANDQMTVCDLRGWGYLTGEGGLNLPEDHAIAIQEANARLIAAAPDLLEVARLGFDLSAYTAAINFNGSPNTPEFLEELGERIEAFQNAANAAIQSATGSEA